MRDITKQNFSSKLTDSPGGGHFDVFGTGYVPLDRV